MKMNITCRKPLVSVLLLFLLGTSPCFAQIQPLTDTSPYTEYFKNLHENPVVGTINDRPIYWADLLRKLIADQPDALNKAVTKMTGDMAQKTGPEKQAAIAQAIESLRQNPTPLVNSTLQQMLQYAAFEQELKDQGKPISDKEISSYLDNLLAKARSNGAIPSTMTDEQFLASRHTTREEMLLRLRPNVEGLYLTQKYLEKQQGHPFGPDDFVQASHILISVRSDASTSPADKALNATDAKAKLDGIAADIAAGKITFENAAKRYSDDGSKDQGGDLGVFTHDMMVPEFDRAAFALKVGEVSRPVKTQFGWHLIRLDKRGDAIPKAERDRVLEQLKQRNYQTYTQSLISQYKIVNLLQVPPVSVPKH